MNKTNELYRGKAKTVYETDNNDFLVLHFRNDTSAHDGEKIQQLAHKGAVNNQFNAFIMTKLQAAGIPTHFEKTLSENESLVKRLQMIPVECVVRNYAAGSICRRLGIKEAAKFITPIFEFFLKNDVLHDPMLNEDHIYYFGLATPEELQAMRDLTFKVNQVLSPLFADAGMTLVDYKLEFGRYHGELVLGDEFTPDGCRIWDSETGEKLDKDRFRQDLGNVVESYQIAAQRLGISITCD